MAKSFYNRDNPFSLTLEGYTLKAHKDTHSAGGINVKIACQIHSIKEWRDQGREIIAYQVFGRDIMIKPEDLTKLIWGDTAAATKSIIALATEKRKLLSPTTLDEVEATYQRLLMALDFVERVLNEDADRAARRTKEQAKATKAKAKAA